MWKRILDERVHIVARAVAGWAGCADVLEAVGEGGFDGLNYVGI